ncbi:MAG: TIGR00730 family Rossman fold protein [Alphaproteobacteria bacterium]|nr:TIGR00730 family Rossman fold protein [Alphaproteobacteria bacterium]MCB1550873.1 TIGR00730 family Rossman fold protein [Alphaproteobacteria bacterium]MCB9985871.1 TIGR00730 family Rossman fold protein [Micavibrio sp.]HPQ50431.1 TIGR00730 family Rossman fold protein [Alphaproteobacteria bacterium]
MSQIKSVCVYCGSSTISDPIFDAPTELLGQSLAKAGITLVYGGGNPGLMGKVANSCMVSGGKVIGITPDVILEQEARHEGVTELHVVPNMHTRKQMMAEKSDAFVVMPGGFGTLDETFEMLTWKYLGLHNKPIIIANINGYWSPLLDLMNHMAKKKFVRAEHMKTFAVAEDVPSVMRILENEECCDIPVQTDKM